MLIIQDNPDSRSFCGALAAAYKKGAFDAKAEVKEINIREIEFNPNLPFGYKNKIEIEKEKNTDEIIEIDIKIYCLTVGTYLIVNLWKARQSIPAAP